MACPRCGGLFQAVSLIDDHHFKMAGLQDIVAQALVVNDGPLQRGIEDLLAYSGFGIHHLDFTLPVDDQSRQGDDEDGAVSRSNCGSDDGLARFPKAHIICK